MKTILWFDPGDNEFFQGENYFQELEAEFQNAGYDIIFYGEPFSEADVEQALEQKVDLVMTEIMAGASARV